MRTLRVAYADPPYPGCAHLYRDHQYEPSNIEARALFERIRERESLLNRFAALVESQAQQLADEQQERADFEASQAALLAENRALSQQLAEAEKALREIADLPEPLGPSISSAAAQCDYLKGIAAAALASLSATTNEDGR